MSTAQHSGTATAGSSNGSNRDTHRPIVSGVVDNVQFIISHNLTVSQLKELLKAVGLPRTGLKSELQVRLGNYLLRQFNNGVYEAIHQLIDELSDIAKIPKAQFYTPHDGATNRRPPMSNAYSQQHQHNANHAHQPTSLPRLQPNDSASFRNHYNNAAHRLGPAPPSATEIQFKESPFYTPIKPLAHPEYLYRPYGSDSRVVSFTFALDIAQTTQLRNGHCAVYLLATSVDEITRIRKSLLHFPTLYDAYVDNVPLLFNVKPIKGKPGAIKPPDVTKGILVGVSHGKRTHSITLRVKLTGDKYDYFICPYLVKVISLDTITASIVNRPHITKEAVISAIKKINEDDDDVVATTSKQTLRDPISYTRMNIPVRGLNCSHTECFDLAYYCELQQQAPAWMCPICNRQIPYEELAVDDYTAEILEATKDKDIDEVEIDPQGKWTVGEDSPPPKVAKKEHGYDSDDGYNDDDEDEPLSNRAKRQRSANPEVEVIDLESDTESDHAGLSSVRSEIERDLQQAGETQESDSTHSAPPAPPAPPALPAQESGLQQEATQDASSKVLGPGNVASVFDQDLMWDDGPYFGVFTPPPSGPASTISAGPGEGVGSLISVAAQASPRNVASPVNAPSSVHASASPGANVSGGPIRSSNFRPPNTTQVVRSPLHLPQLAQQDTPNRDSPSLGNGSVLPSIFSGTTLAPSQASTATSTNGTSVEVPASLSHYLSPPVSFSPASTLLDSNRGNQPPVGSSAGLPAGFPAAAPGTLTTSARAVENSHHPFLFPSASADGTVTHAPRPPAMIKQSHSMSSVVQSQSQSQSQTGSDVIDLTLSDDD